MREAGAEPAFKGYHGYPGDDLRVGQRAGGARHPVDRPLVEGDIVSIDMGAKLDGFYGDSAVTVPVGAVTPEAASAAAR